MITIRQKAEQYKQKQTLTVADLANFGVDAEIHEGEGLDEKGEAYKYNYIEIAGQKYRIPDSVIEQIQTILNLKPTISIVSASKSGSGLGTRYKVSALD